MGSVLLCLGLWIRAKTVDQSSRDNAERRAIFVGLWAPTLWLMGDALERAEQQSGHRWHVRRPARVPGTLSGRKRAHLTAPVVPSGVRSAFRAIKSGS